MPGHGGQKSECYDSHGLSGVKLNFCFIIFAVMTATNISIALPWTSIITHIFCELDLLMIDSKLFVQG